ncbi:MAG TPA: flavin reductase family protein [Desulfobacteria bacterium]|nr:flavin reductase family protein [Desulfobacteria bacterium]
MSKVTKKPSTVLLPVPTVLVSCQAEDGRQNLITIAWTGIMNSVPPTVYIGVQPARFSHGIIKEAGEYVINIPSADIARQVDYCGITSGREVDKFAETGLTPVSASEVKAPLIKECPVNIECKVKQILNLGSHDAFIAEVVSVHYDENILDANGRPDMAKIKPYGYCQGEYRAIAEKIGTFGYSGKKFS